MGTSFVEELITRLQAHCRHSGVGQLLTVRRPGRVRRGVFWAVPTRRTVFACRSFCSFFVHEILPTWRIRAAGNECLWQNECAGNE